MFRRMSVTLWAGLAITSLCFVVGCKQDAPAGSGEKKGEGSVVGTSKSEYNPHDVPITEEQKAKLKEEAAKFSGAVAKINEFCSATEEATKDGIPEDPYKAHQALDQVDLVLQWLPQIARDSGVPKEHWEEINTMANDLRTLFEKVHQNIDSRQDPDFASVAEPIDEKIARLEEIAQLTSSGASEG